MNNESDEPISSKPAPGTGDGENELIPAPDIAADPDPNSGEDSTRHDGWTGQRMAMFCALLAETGIVTDACHAVGMSTTSAYSARRRNPLFAAAWEEALSLARNRLADALLERSLTGSVEKYYRDGELIGEKRIVDNKLGIAILRRLDRMAETGRALHSNLPAPPPAVPAQEPDWDLMLAALRSGDEDMMAEAMVEVRKAEGPALSLSKGDEVGEVANPPNRPPDAVNFDDEEEPERCWWDEEEKCWMTNFPPPPGFDGYEERRWGDEDYERECTKEEAAALQAALDSELAEERSEDEAERDQWFAAIRHPSHPLPSREGEGVGASASEDCASSDGQPSPE